MKKIISKVFIRMIALSMLMLSFGRDVFGASAAGGSFDDNYLTAGVSTYESPADNMINLAQSLLIVFLIPFSALLAVFFYFRYFLVKKKMDDISKLKAKKFLKKANVCLVVVVLLVTLAVIFKYFRTSF
jgi:uncharacterized membrane protein YidH (DUF202 family)